MSRPSFQWNKSRVVAAMLASSGGGSPGPGLLPLTPKNWQMDVLQVRVNHENQDNADVLGVPAAGCLSSLTRSVLNLFATA